MSNEKWLNEETAKQVKREIEEWPAWKFEAYRCLISEDGATYEPPIESNRHEK